MAANRAAAIKGGRARMDIETKKNEKKMAELLQKVARLEVMLIERRRGGRRSDRIRALSLVVLLIQLAISLSGGSQQLQLEREREKSSCHLRELELCSVGAASMLQNPNGIPTSQREFNRQCEYLNESTQCFHDYRDNCATKLQAALFSRIGAELVTFKDDFCTSGTELNGNYMKHASCLREVQKKHQRQCMADFQVGFEAIHKISRPNRMATACCNVSRLRGCVMPRIEDKCGKEALEFVQRLLSRAVGRTFDITCRNYDYDGNNRCKELLPKVGTRPHNGMNTSAISRIISSYARTI